MKAKRKVTDKNWEFDGTTVTVRIPMTWKRHGGRKVIIAPDGSDARVPAKPRPDETADPRSRAGTSVAAAGRLGRVPLGDRSSRA